MRKTIKFLFFVTVALTLAKSGFAQTADVKQGCVPLTVKFAPPDGLTTYYWDFKDGATSNLEKPSNIFTKGGTYDVIFRETQNGPTVGTVKITVYDAPDLTIAVPPGCAPLNANFSNTTKLNPAIQVNNYVWVWGDGSSSAGIIPNATHTYASVGKYSVSFSIETQYSSCNKTKIFNNVVEVLSPPVASFATTPAFPVTCKDTIKVGFVDQSSGAKPLSYSWTFGNGAKSTSKTPAQQTFIKGQYNPSLTVSYTGITGCVASTSSYVSAGSPKAVIVLEKKDTVCINSPSKFKTTSKGVYFWDFGPNASPQTSTFDSVYVSFSKPGIQQVSLKVTSFDGQCSETKSVKIYVDEVTAAIVGSKPFICEPTVITYTAVTNQPNNVTYEWANNPYWTAGEGKTFSPLVEGYTHRDFYKAYVAEFYDTFLRVTSKLSGCSATAGITGDTLFLPLGGLKADVYNGCTPLKVVFRDSSWTADSNPLVKWEWNFADGTPKVTATNNAPVNHTYTVPGVYKASLIVTSLRGCRDTSYVFIKVGGDLSSQLDFTSTKTEVCPGESVSFNTNISAQTAGLIEAYHFSSEGNRVSHCTDQNSVEWVYNDLTGPQNVSLTVDYNGCLSKVTKAAFVNVKGAIAKIDYEALCTSPLLYNFNSVSQQATSVKWSFGDGQNSTSTAEPHNYASSGNYQVVLEALNAASGCAATRDTALVKVRQVKSVITLPSQGLFCKDQPYDFSSANSKDVAAECYSGYKWDFISVDKLPYTTAKPLTTFRFEQPGTGIARLIVKDVNGCQDTATARFKVYKVDVRASIDKDQLCLGTSASTVLFTDQSIGDTTISAWRWEFGDGASATTKTVSHQYTTIPPDGARYYVLFKAFNTIGCEKDTTFGISYYKPVTNVTVSKPYHCLGDTISVSASDFTEKGSSLTYSWNFEDGKTSTLQSNKIVYSQAKPYAIGLKFKETSTGCTDSVTTFVDVQSYPVAYIHTDVDKALKYLCADKNITFEDSTQSAFPISQYWDFGNGQTSSANKFALFYPKGSFTTNHIVSTGYGCKDTATVTYNIVRPEGDFDIDKSLICKGESIKFTLKDAQNVSSYSWIYGDGVIDQDQTPVTHQYNFHPGGGSTKATLLLKGYEDMCPWPVEKFITIRQVIADFTRENGGDTSICFSQGAYHFANTSSGYNRFSWDFGDGTTSVEMNPEHIFNPGIYDVKMSVVDDQANCSDEIVKKAIVFANPTVVATADTVCLGKPVGLKVVNPQSSDSYLWTPSIGLSSDTSRAPIANLQHSQLYQVMVTDVNSCSDTTEVNAVVIEPINLTNWDTTIVIGDKAVLPVYAPQDVYKFKWTPTAGLSCLDCYYPVAQPLEDIVYVLQVSDVRQCYVTDLNYDIKIRPETFVKMPTVFTPNGDGNNDVIYVKGWGIKELVDFSVFNRWGQLLYSSNNMDEGWDGKYNGSVQNNDVYIYKIKVKTWRDEEIKNEGYINLLR